MIPPRYALLKIQNKQLWQTQWSLFSSKEERSVFVSRVIGGSDEEEEAVNSLIEEGIPVSDLERFIVSIRRREKVKIRYSPKMVEERLREIRLLLLYETPLQPPPGGLADACTTPSIRFVSLHVEIYEIIGSYLPWWSNIEFEHAGDSHAIQLRRQAAFISQISCMDTLHRAKAPIDMNSIKNAPGLKLATKKLK